MVLRYKEEIDQDDFIFDIALNFQRPKGGEVIEV